MKGFRKKTSKTLSKSDIWMACRSIVAQAAVTLKTKGDQRGPKGTPKGPRRPNVSKVCNCQQKQGGPKGTQGRPKGTQGGPKGTQAVKIGPGVSTKPHFAKSAFLEKIKSGLAPRRKLQQQMSQSGGSCFRRGETPEKVKNITFVK